jgi:hypothetical protein
LADVAKVLSLTTQVDSTREAVVKELEGAATIAREVPDRVVGCAVVIVTLSDDGLHHVHTNTECPKNATLQMMGAIQILAADLVEGLEKYPAFEPEPKPEGDGDDR